MKRLLFVILLTIMGCCGVHVQAVGYEKLLIRYCRVIVLILLSLK